MTLTIELLPDPAANDLRLTQLAAERPSPLTRLNILHGSALQRLSTQRMLAEANGGALAGVYGFTPVDLAQAASGFGDAPARQSWPAGADLTTLRRVLHDVELATLDPQAPGVAAALLRTLTDLREAALTPEVLPDGDLEIVFTAWREATATAADRTSRYEDAISPTTPDTAFREALGGAPLIVSGIYDLTRIQRLLLKRLAAATDVRMLLVAPSDDPASPPQHTLTALRRDLNARVIRPDLPKASLAPDHYFSVGDPTAEADEIASRILALAGDGVAFHRIAILHQQGSPTDDRICAALGRADIPSWRIGGRQLARTPIGHAVQRLARVLLSPATVERSELLDWLSHRVLRERLLDHHRHPAQWERASIDAGLTRNLLVMEERLDRWREANQSGGAEDLVAVVHNLSERSREIGETDSWASAADLLIDAFDLYLDDQRADQSLRLAARDVFDQLRNHDALGSTWSAQDGLTALGRSFGSRVVRDPRRLIGGVNVGAATGPARGIRYDAIFTAGVAERIFPAVGRQDPLLPDAERAAINQRVPDALALQRDRGDSDRHAWELLRRAAQQQFTASWSRRSSAVGGPARPSSLILESAAEGVGAPNEAQTESALSDIGSIQRIESAVVTTLPSAADIEEHDWTAAIAAPDEQSFDLALLSSPNADTRSALPELWPPAEAAEHARLQRNAPSFTEFDGVLDSTRIGEDWNPLGRTWSASAIETFVTCPYRFYLRHIVGARAEPDAARPDQPRRDILSRLIRRMLSTWAEDFVHSKRRSNLARICEQRDTLQHHRATNVGPCSRVRRSRTSGIHPGTATRTDAGPRSCPPTRGLRRPRRLESTRSRRRLRRRADPRDRRQKHSIPRPDRPYRPAHRRTPTRRLLVHGSNASRCPRIRQRLILSRDRQSDRPDSARSPNPASRGRAALGHQARRIRVADPAWRIADHARRSLSPQRRRATTRHPRRNRRSARIGQLHPLPGQPAKTATKIADAAPTNLPAPPTSQSDIKRSRARTKKRSDQWRS